jgi:hypothetical protein
MLSTSGHANSSSSSSSNGAAAVSVGATEERHLLPKVFVQLLELACFFTVVQMFKHYSAVDKLCSQPNETYNSVGGTDDHATVFTPIRICVNWIAS